MIAPAPPAPTASPAPPGGLELRIETPENVVLTYTLAGPATRAAAYLIDLGIRLMVMTAVGIGLGIVAAVGLLPGVANGVLLILWFLMEWGYYTLFETFWRGRSPGKWALGLRVVQDKGYPVTFWAAAGRNLLRAADGLPFLLLDRFVPVYAVGFATMLLSPRMQRLGDLLARTVVVHERRAAPPREPAILEKIEPLPREVVPGPAPPPRTLHLIDRFLGRRNAVPVFRGHEIARPLARAVANRLRYAGDPELVERYPMAFLARVHVTFLKREEDESDVDARRSRGMAIPRRPVEEARR